ncbi:SymE family type I addiction module toxin [Pectobacterium sp. CHL-2024]|uniref:SymE family type I addiction module toxin n=1 Tax=Pectobacterium sp. CHL-2024 TaxID=3377079 RepID=UPI00380B4773
MVVVSSHTAGYAPQNGRPNSPPAINLKGCWLKSRALSPGCPSLLSLSGDRIVIEAETNL